MTPDRLAHTPLPETQRIALRLEKGRYATPRAWTDPLDAIKQARFRARHWPDGRPAPLENTYADAYKSLRRQMPDAGKRLRMADMLALDTMQGNPHRLPRRTF